MRMPLHYRQERRSRVPSWLVWGILLLCLPSETGVAARDDQIVSAIRADSHIIAVESNEVAGPALGDRRDIHAELPPDANLPDVLHAYTGSQADSLDGGRETPCPCRTDAPESDADEGPPPHPMGLIGLGFGSVVFVFLAAFAVWKTYTTRDSPRP